VLTTATVGQPDDLGREAAVGREVEHAIARRPRVTCKATRAGRELEARRRRAHPPHPVAQHVEGLVGVAPEHRAHLAVACHERAQGLGVSEPQGVEVRRVHQQRRVMQAQEDVCVAVTVEFEVEFRERGLAEPAFAVGGLGKPRFEQQYAPVADREDAAGLERRVTELAVQLGRIVMVAGHDQCRDSQRCERQLEGGVAARVVVHDVAGHEDRLRRQRLATRVLQAGAETSERVHAAQPRLRIAEQVRVREVQQPDCARVCIGIQHGPVSSAIFLDG
jgi:hypothetical protein